jgi:hypothetical protein
VLQTKLELETETFNCTRMAEKIQEDWLKCFQHEVQLQKEGKREGYEHKSRAFFEHFN